MQFGSRPIERLLTGIRPTPLGVATAEPARGVLREIATEEKKVWATVSGRAGRFRVGVSCVPRRVARYRKTDKAAPGSGSRLRRSARRPLVSMPPQCRSLSPVSGRHSPSARPALRSRSSISGKSSRKRPDAAGAARRQGAADPVLGLLEGAQEAPGLFGGHRAEGGRARACRRAFEQRRPETALDPGGGAGQRRPGHRQPVGRGDDLARLGDRKELLQLAPPFEHAQRLPRSDRRIEYGISMQGPAAITVSLGGVRDRRHRSEAGSDGRMHRRGVSCAFERTADALKPRRNPLFLSFGSGRARRRCRTIRDRQDRLLQTRPTGRSLQRRAPLLHRLFNAEGRHAAIPAGSAIQRRELIGHDRQDRRPGDWTNRLGGLPRLR